METINNETNGIYLGGSDQQTSNSINLTGCWFVNFGVNLPNYNIEGSRILTLKGNFDPDDLMDILINAIHNDLPQDIKETLEKYGCKVVIRAFNRI